MIRIVIENILLFLLPTLLYLAYNYVLRRSDNKDTSSKPRPAAGQVLNDAPLLWLFVAGAGLVLATLIVFGDTTGGRPGQTYHPPVVKDGKIHPGYFE